MKKGTKAQRDTGTQGRQQEKASLNAKSKTRTPQLITHNSQRLFERAQKSLVGGVNSPVRAFKAVSGVPVFIQKGKGSQLTDADGNRYVDFVCSWGPLILGHAHPDVEKAAKKALERGASFGASTEAEIKMAEIVKEAFPSMELMRFVSSGTEACMSALRAARGFTGRKKIVKFEGCYHGHSDFLLVKAGSGALTFGSPDSAGVPKDAAKHTLVLPYNNISAVKQLFRAQGKNIAAVIVEPVVGNMGTVLPEAGFLETLREQTQKHGALLIFDEVITGFRLCFGGAQTIFKIEPDLTCLGKIIGGGFPVGAYGGRKDVMQCVSPLGSVYQAGTLSGNPVAMSAGLKTLEILKRARPYAKLHANTDMLCHEIKKLAEKHGIDVCVNHTGSMFTVFFTKEKNVRGFLSAKTSDTKKYAKFFHLLLQNGVYFPPAQFEAAFLSVAHTPKDLHKTLRAVERAF